MSSAVRASNCGGREQLTIAGVPVGKGYRKRHLQAGAGSIISSCDRCAASATSLNAWRAAPAWARRTCQCLGEWFRRSFVAFSTHAGAADPAQPTHSVATGPNDRMDPIFCRNGAGVEEASINALVANQSMTGRDNHLGGRSSARPGPRLLKKYTRCGEFTARTCLRLM